MKLISLLFISLFLFSCAGVDKGETASKDSIELERVSHYLTDAGFDNGGVEIVAYDKISKRVFSTNGDKKNIDIIDLSNPLEPKFVKSINPSKDQEEAKAANSVAFNNVLVAAVENKIDGGNGFAMIYSREGEFLKSVEIGVLPDMVTITKDGKYAVIALEAEPYVSENSIKDPEGGIAVINLENYDYSYITLDNALIKNEKSVRTPLANEMGAPAYVDFEPEYITTSEDSKYAYICLQENNAVAIVDIVNSELVSINGLGFKDHNLPGNGLDANKGDKGALIETANFSSLYLPDSIGSFTAEDGKTYIITANEGDDRELEDDNNDVIYTDLGEFDHLSSDDLAEGYDIDLSKYPGKEFLKDMGLNKDGKYERLYVGGARSFSIWNSDVELVYDSGDDFEQYLSKNFPEVFNCADDDLKIDSRSDDAGPDPEGLAVGKVGDKTYAFIGLEKFGGVMVYNVTDPNSPEFITFVSGRNYSANVDEEFEYEDKSYNNTGDIAPEGLLFISKEDSPNNMPLLLVANEVSGSLEIYQIK